MQGKTDDGNAAQKAAKRAVKAEAQGRGSSKRGTDGAKNAKRVPYDGRPPLPNEELLYGLAEFVKLFGDTTRMKILCTLSGGELCVCDIAESVGLSQSAVSHQLRILKNGKLVKFRRDGKTIYYSLDDAHVVSIIKQGTEHVCE